MSDRPVQVWKAALLNHKPKPRLRRTYNDCSCPCCIAWRSWLGDVKDFNRSVTASYAEQCTELELLKLDEEF